MTNNRLFLVVISFCVFLGKPAIADEFENWLDKEFAISKTRLLENISPDGTLPGTVVASPSRSNPNYFYHWVRDAGLVMLTVWRMVDHSTDEAEKRKLINKVYDYYLLTKKHQSAHSPGGLGEVKFYVDGTPFTGPWGRPQNDGPALRASSLIRLAQTFISRGQMDKARDVYEVVKKDLQYVASNWRNHDFDLWEEIKGHHFFTRMVQMRALTNGAELARSFRDGASVNWFLHQARLVKQELNYHWNDSWGIFVSTLNRVDGIHYKNGMDSSVILSAIYTYEKNDKGAFSVNDRRFMSSHLKMKQKFGEIYGINRTFSNLGTAIGRYPEDRYDGYGTGGQGNPWFLNTAGFANYLYKLAYEYKASGEIRIGRNNVHFLEEILNSTTEKLPLEAGVVIRRGDDQFKPILKGLVKAGDNYLKRMRFHMDENGHMSEQMNRDRGVMQGARDLTWSYSSFIDAYMARQISLR